MSMHGCRLGRDSYSVSNRGWLTTSPIFYARASEIDLSVIMGQYPQN